MRKRLPAPVPGALAAGVLLLALLPAPPAAAAAPPPVSPMVQSGPAAIVQRVQDTYISNKDAADHSGGAFLHIGTPDGGTTKYRSFLQFDVSALRGATITDARLRLYNSYTGSCDGWWMYAFPVAAAWSQSTITWANQPAVDSSATYQAAANFGIGNAALGCPDTPDFTDPDASDGIHRLDVTAMVRDWASGVLPNRGLRLSAGEQGTQAYKDFCSMNPAAPSGQNPCVIAYDTPTLEITYQPAHPVVAVPNGRTRSIEFYDAARTSAWNGTAKYQSWAADAYHSITDGTLAPGYGGGTDAKLRPGGAYGPGQVLLVSDGTSGFVGVIPYPQLSGRLWAINVGPAATANVHGVELLPDGNVAVALSQSNLVQIYSRAAGENWTGTRPAPLGGASLAGAHEVLYDPANNALWAVGNSSVVEYSYDPATIGATGELSQIAEYAIPAQTAANAGKPAYGHDIEPVYADPDRLWVTSNAGVLQLSKSGTAACAVAQTPEGWPATTAAGVGTRWCADYASAAAVQRHRQVKSIGDDPATGGLMEVWAAAGDSSPVVTFFTGGTETATGSNGADTYYRAHYLVPAYQ
ncbi:DNRLRE domain-containing protein [Hamadaea tsunoensis]|uniref:DNRLRE domain-containing protein n=1 Tax=Hamadaea tsunoensis TaxID=53368 RepID=UPI0003FC8472|nr:DNRLRE domain-containing protein [Hamadaea tsunoensis]